MRSVSLVTKVWRSGTGWYAQMLAGAIAEAGATISFISPRAEPAWREPVHPNLARIVTPREIIVPAPRSRRAAASLRRSLTGVAATLRARRSGRVFIFSIPEPLVFTLPLFVALRLLGARLIYIVHDAQPHAWKFKGILRSVERWAHGLSYRLAHHLVVLAPSARDALQRAFGISASKISVIPHGPFEIGAVPPLPGSGRFLAFGTVRRNKNVLETIKGVRLARRDGLDVRLRIAGEPHPQELDYWEACLREIAADPAGFEVDRRFVPDEELPGILATVDAFILAYDNFDSQSGVAVLAAISGRPVIGSDSGGLADLFRDGMCGARIEGGVSAETIADAIRSFLAVPVTEWQARAAAGAEAVSASIAWSRVGAMFVSLAERLDAPGSPQA